MIPITYNIAIPETELTFTFIRSSGPGGQNVNKTATAVQLRFDVARSACLPPDVRRRLLSLGGRRVTSDGVLVIDARRFRTQERNRQDALNRLAELVRKAAEKPKVRRKTRPSLGSGMRRLEDKRHRGQQKRLRRVHAHNDA